MWSGALKARASGDRSTPQALDATKSRAEGRAKRASPLSAPEVRSLVSSAGTKSAGLRSRRSHVRVVHEVPTASDLDVAKWSKAAACKAVGECPHPFESDRRVQFTSPVAQLAERLAVNQEVRGSKPRRGAMAFQLGVAQMAARVIWDHETAGSSPATETSFKRVLGCGRSSMAEPWAVNPLAPVRLRPVTPKHTRITCVANSSGRVPAS